MDLTKEAPVVTAAGRYDNYSSTRDPHLRRGRACSELTIPTLLPPEGATGATEFYQPYQSVGADGVNNLAAKLLMVLFPAGESFFRFTIDEFTIEELMQKAGGQQEGALARAQFESALGKLERSIVNRMEETGARKVIFEALLHLIVTGNGLLYVDKQGKLKFFRLDKYVVKRDLEGNILEIIVKECISRLAVPPAIKAILSKNPEADKHKTDTEDVQVYTWVKRKDNGGWEGHQEVEGQKVPGTEFSYPAGKSAWLVLRWTAVSGEDYGRGRCEEYYGDLYSLEEAERSTVKHAAVASKVVGLVNPGGITDPDALAEAESGEIIEGNAKDVTFLQVEKAHDFQIVRSIAEDRKERLERAFLLFSQRNAERVTAEEIRTVISELNQTIGGVYSILSEEFQRPLVVRLQFQMEKAGDLPKLPEGVVSPKIIAGLDGLGRSSDMGKLDILLSGVSDLFTPEALKQWVNVGDYIARRAAALGIDTKGLIRTSEEVQQSEDRGRLADMAQAAVGPGIGAMKDMAMASQEQATAPTGEA